MGPNRSPGAPAPAIRARGTGPLDHHATNTDLQPPKLSGSGASGKTCTTRPRLC